MFIQRICVFVLLFGIISSEVTPSSEKIAENEAPLSPDAPNSDIENESSDPAPSANNQDESKVDNDSPQYPAESKNTEDSQIENSSSSAPASASPERTQTADSTTSYIHAIKGPVHAEVISPDRWQRVSIRGSKLFVNGKRVVRDISQLSSTKTYQRKADGSLWYTNLPVGTPMTEDEIKQFEKDASEKRKAVNEKSQTNEKDNIRDVLPSADSTTDYLFIIKGPVQAEVISPNGWQKVNIKGSKVFLNKKRIVRDISKLSSTQTYQKRADGSKWYTNMPVGTPMTEDEIQQFEKDANEKRKTVYKKSETKENAEDETIQEIKTRALKDRTYTTDSRGYLNMHTGGVDAQVISPEFLQRLEFWPRGINVNGRLIYNSRFASSPTYQVGGEDARWYTNLPMGRAMTQEEIDQFKKDAEVLENTKE